MKIVINEPRALRWYYSDNATRIADMLNISRQAVSSWGRGKTHADWRKTAPALVETGLVIPTVVAADIQADDGTRIRLGGFKLSVDGVTIGRLEEHKWAGDLLSVLALCAKFAKREVI